MDDPSIAVSGLPSEDLAQALFTLGSQAQLIVALDSGLPRVIGANPAAEALFGSIDSGRPLDKLIGPNALEDLRAGLEKDQSCVIDVRGGRGRLPRELAGRISGRRLSTANGDPRWILRLERLLLPITHSAPEVIDAVETVAEHVLHDLRNYLTPLISHVELALDAVDRDSEAFSSLLEVQAACRLCETTMSELQDLAPPSSAKRWIHLSDIVSRSARVIEYLPPRGLRLSIDSDGSLRLIECHLDALQKTLVALTLGAALIRNPNAQVALSVRDFEGETGAEIEICIPDERSRKEQLEDDRALQAIISNHIALDDCAIQGDVNAERLSIRFSFPGAVGPGTEPSDVGEAGQGEKLLILHDDAMTRSLLRSYLADKGYVVEAAAAVEDAAGAVALRGIDAVVLAAGRIEEAPSLLAKGIKAVVVCGGENQADESNTTGLSFLASPFRMQDLARHLRDALPA